jgi:hypothetical protein
MAIHPVTGEFTGILEENVRLAVYDLMPGWSYQRLKNEYFEVLQEFFRLGFGSIHTVETLAEFKISREAHQNSELGLRTFYYLPIKDLETVYALAEKQNPSDIFLRVAGVKLFVDGSFGSQTAELFENYQTLNHSGVENITEAELDRLVSRAVAAKLSCAVHAIGDRAIHKTLQVFGKHYSESFRRNLRHRIEHAQLILPADIPFFAEYKVSASVQPVHLAADVEIIKKYLGDRQRLTYPYKSLLKSGANLVFGSDMPIENFNPWHAIYTAMERRFLMNPSNERFRPEQCLDLPTSIKAYTVNPAAVVGLSDKLGRIIPGMKADVFLADRNIFKTDVEDLKETKSVLTIVNGCIVYDDPGE